MPPDPPSLFTLKRMQWPYQSKIVGAGPELSDFTVLQIKTNEGPEDKNIRWFGRVNICASY